MKSHYHASELTEPFQIVRKTRVADGAGGFDETETTLPSPTTYHFAKVRPVRGQEREANQQVEAGAELLFVIHRDVALVPTDVLLYASARYNISAILPPRLDAFQEVTAASGGVN